MSFRFTPIVRTFVIAAAGLVLLLTGLKQAKAVEEDTSQAAANAGEVVIQATERFSIPYGFSGALPLTNDGASLVVSGEGACTAGEAISIAYTVTQSTNGASVTGLWNGTCAGDRQTWTSIPTATPSPNFAAGMAEACAFAETSSDGSTTDTLEWCDDVLLASDRVFLPHVQKPQ